MNWICRWSRIPTVLEEMSVHRLLQIEKVINLMTNSSPQAVLAQFGVLVDGEKLHHTKVLHWPRGWREDICGRPVDELGAKLSLAADTIIVEVGLELGDTMGSGVDGNEAGRIVVVPEPEMLGGTATGAGGAG